MMNTTRRLTTAAAGTLLALGLASCGWIAEEAIEQAVESETGGDVEIDFDSDDGTLSIEGENGESFNFDIDEDGEQSTFSGTDEDGNSFEMTSGDSLPDDWPGDVPLPSGSVVAGSSMTDNTERLLTVTVDVDNAEQAHEGYLAQLEGAGFTQGSNSTFTSDGSTTSFTDLSKQGWVVQVTSLSDGEGTDQMIVSLQSRAE